MCSARIISGELPKLKRVWVRGRAGGGGGGEWNKGVLYRVTPEKLTKIANTNCTNYPFHTI